MSLDPTLQARIRSLLEGNRVVLFMKGSPTAPQCGFSAKAVGALADTGVQYAHVDVLADQDIREGIKAYSQWPTIPQLYIGGELVGGSDIIEQMANSGELHAALGVPAPDRTPPTISIAPDASEIIKSSIANAGGHHALQVAIDANFNARLQLVPADAAAIATEADGVRVQFDPASARRAEGLRIEWVDDARGKGLSIENPNAPPKVGALAPDEVARRVAAHALLLVDVRPAAERTLAEAPVAHRTLDDGLAGLEALPKDTAIAFLCHHGTRSGQAAEHFRQLGFRDVHNVTGGIDAWAGIDPSIARY